MSSSAFMPRVVRVPINNQSVCHESASGENARLRCTVLNVVAGLACALCVPLAQAAIQFEDVSAQTNMTGFTEGWGVSVGDGNGDNCPDLFVQGHRDYPRFYRNTCDGSFEDIAYEVDPGNWIAKPYDDKHAAAWGDFDNDGDEDLVLDVSVTGFAQLLVNQGNGTFLERAADADLASDSSGRMPVWFDYTGDGYLDIAQTYLGNALLRRQDPADGLDFDDDKTGTGFSCPGRIDWAQMMDIDNDGSLEFICATVGSFPVRVFDVSQRPFINVSSSFPSVPLVSDAISADFNNDLLYDMVLIRGLLRPSGATQVSPHRIESWLRTSPAAAANKGFTFSAPGQITVTMDHSSMTFRESSRVFVLNSSSNNSLSDGPLEIDYNSTQQRWEVVIRNTNEHQAYVQVDTISPVTNFVVTGLEHAEGPLDARHLVNSPTGLNFDFSTGLTENISCVSGAAGDFNNDMWVDLYLVCGNGVDNIANRVYENQGDGTFLLVGNHGGEGPVGTGFDFGVGESVVVLDYDGDGRLDAHVNNGLLFYPVHIGGPDTMLRNTTSNANHWIEIDLRGTESNRDGVGASVFLTAGGVTQKRMQDGGYHRVSQNHQRLHFGLAGNPTANMRIEWPSGQVDTHDNVQADKLYEAVEGGAITEQTFGPPIRTQLEAGDECGQPPYNFDYGPVVLMWRDCPSGVWHLRAKGGRESETKLFTDGTINADTAFSNVSGHQLAAGDSLNNTGNELTFSVGVWFTNDKGINFSTAGQSTACIEFSRQDIKTLIVGSSGKRISYAFDLFSLAECEGAPPPPPADPECGEPVYDRQSEPGFYAWRDCAFGGPAARWNFRAVGGGRTWDRYAGAVTSDMPLSATSSGLAGNDFVDSSPGDSEVDFQLFVGGQGEDSFQIDVPASSQTCLTMTAMPPGTTVQVGAGRQVMTDPFDLLTLEACTVEPPPPVDPACGAPAFNPQTEPGVFIWRNCEASGAGSEWHARFAAGGTGWSPYEGAVTSDMPLGATGVGLRAPDAFDSVPGDETVEFRLWSGGGGVDGFQLDVPDGAQTCFEMTELKPGAQVELGAGRQVMGSSFQLETLGTCD
jgi:hypothetical protein